MRAYRAGQADCRRWPRYGVAGYTRPAQRYTKSRAYLFVFLRLAASQTTRICPDVVFPVLYNAIYNKPLFL